MRILLIVTLLSMTAYAEKKLNCPSKKHYLQKGFHAGTTKIATLHCVLNGDFDGPIKAWHPNGKIKKEGQYLKGDMEGTWTRWHKNGKMHDQGKWRESRPIGEWKQWHPTGTPHKIGSFTNGEKIGIWKIWDHKNKLREVNFGKSKDDYAIEFEPVSEVLMYNVDWSDAQATYTTKMAFDNTFIWKHKFSEKWKSIVLIGQRLRKFDYEGQYHFNEENNYGMKVGFGAEYKTKKRTWGLMIELFNEFFIQHGTQFNPQDNSLKLFRFQNAYLKLYADQYLYRGDKLDWKLNAALILITNQNEDGEDIDTSDQIYALPQGGFGAELSLQADYKISSRKSLYFIAEARYQQQNIKRIDTGMEFATNRISLGLATGYRFNFGRMGESKADEMKNWLSISLTPVSELLTYTMAESGASANYGLEEGVDFNINWNRTFSKKWSGVLNFTISTRVYDSGENSDLFHNDSIDDATTLSLGLQGKRFGFHLGIKNQIIMRYTPLEGKISVDTALNPIAMMTYKKNLFKMWNMNFSTEAQLLLLAPNFLDTDEFDDDDDQDGFNDNIIDAGFGGEGKISLIGKYMWSPRKILSGITFFQYGYQSVTMKDTYTDFNVTKMTVGLGAQFSYLF